MDYYDKLSIMNIFLVSFYIYGYIKNYTTSLDNKILYSIILYIILLHIAYKKYTSYSKSIYKYIHLFIVFFITLCPYMSDSNFTNIFYLILCLSMFYMWYDSGGCWLSIIQYANEKNKYKTFMYDWIIKYKIDYIVLIFNILYILSNLLK